MIKCKINKKRNLVRVRATGSLADIEAESIAFIKTLYTELKNRNGEAADDFRRTMAAAILDPNSPVFKREEKIA